MSEHTIALSRRTFIGGTAAIGISACCLSPSLAFATPTAAEKQAEAQAALDSLEAMQDELGIVVDTYNQALMDVEAAQQKMDEAQERINEANEQIANLQEKLGTRARTMYCNGSSTMLDFLLGATTFQELTQNWNLLTQMNQDDADMVQETKDLRAEVEAQKEEYAQQKKVAEEKAAEAEQAKVETEAKVAEMQAVYNNLSAEAAELLEEERAAREAARAQAAQEAINSGNVSTGSSNNGGGNSNTGANSGSTSGGSTNTPAYNSGKGSSIVARAQSCLGKPYVYGATGPDSFDCSGLVGYALYGSYGRHVTSGSFASGPFVSNPQPGDVCYKPGHVGIYIGGGQMVHAPAPGQSVCVAGVQGGMRYVRW